MGDQFDRLTAALLGRYAIEGELGAGGMASVYLAEDVKHHRKVAVKVLRPELAVVIGADRFVREIQIAAQLNHPNILPLHDSGESDGILYYVMPAVDGESLAARLRREGRLPIGEAVRIACQMAAALDYAHRHGVIHRDIKPDNVLLHEGVAMVMDFGIALAVGESGATRFTGTGLSLGTPHYMSPEQAAGEREVDARTDVYALGCVLFEMLTGEPPFKGETVQSLIVQRITDSAPLPSTLRDEIPEWLDASVAKALETSADDRFDSPAAFAAAVEGGTASGSRRPTRWSHPAMAAALFGIGSLAVLGAVYVIVLRFALPDWVLWSAFGLLALGLPVMVATALSQRSWVTRPGRQRLTWRRTVRGGVLAFGALAGVTAAYAATKALGIGPAATLVTMGVLDTRDPILLADFANRTTDTTLAATLTELLRIDLSQSRTIRLVDPATVAAVRERMVVDASAPLDAAMALEMAQREGVKAVLVGGVSRVGAGFAVSARLLAPADGSVLTAERATAPDDTQLIAALDRLSAHLRARIGESLRDVRRSPALERVTTTSLTALYKYTQAVGAPKPGVSAFMRIAWLQEAAAMDSTFAMAYRRMGILLIQSGRREEGRAALRRAFELRDRLPAVERDIVTGMFYNDVEYDASRIEAAYQSLLTRDPDNQLALINLAVLRSRTRQWAERESLAQRAVDAKETVLGYLHLYRAQLLQRKYDDAAATIQRYHWQGTATWSFDLETARRRFERAEQILREGDSRWNEMLAIVRVRGKLAEAERGARNLMVRAPPESGASRDVRFPLAWLLVDYGSMPDAIQLLEDYPFDSLPPGDRRYLERAELYAGVGQVDRARELMVEFEEQTPDGVRRHPDNRMALSRVAGEIAINENRFDDAVADFTVVNELSAACTTCGLARLAYAWLRSGRADSAVAVYERLLSTPTEGLNEDDVRWLPVVYRQLGELYEARNDTSDAVNAYAEFIELWKDADPELQLVVNDVKGRIAKLIGDTF